MIRILFLSANPNNADTLLAGDELRQIEAALKGSRFEVIAKPAVRLYDLPDLLRQSQAAIVHFSGHGSRYGELMFVNEQGESQSASISALAKLFELFKEQVRCVVLNACYSDEQAAAIAEQVECVLGFEGAIRDDAARAFARGFYSALAAGETLVRANEFGLNEIERRYPEALLPCHLEGQGDANTLRPLEWDDTTRPSPPATRGIFGLYPFNEHFFGRDDELAQLHTLLQTQNTVSICPVITGMGGLGKTQLAAHYARRHEADYPDGIFWVTAADLNAIRGQLADFCVALGLPVADPQRTGDLSEQKITAFKHYLDEHPQALLIFDNVEEPDHLRTRQIGVQMTALTLGGKLLVTTRRRKVERDRFVELPLQRLLPAPARQILLTARADLAQDPELNRLCDQFGYLPLMLNLAAAALKKRGGAIAGYLQRLHTLGAEKLHNDVAKVSLDDYHKSLSAVLQEQWAMLQDENARLLFRVAGQLPEAEIIPAARLGLLAGLQDMDEWERPLSDALDELERASLIERVDNDTIRQHPLVRIFAVKLTQIKDVFAFRSKCVSNLHFIFSDIKSLEHNIRARNIFAVENDLAVAISLLENWDKEFLAKSALDSQIDDLNSLLRLFGVGFNVLVHCILMTQSQFLTQQLSVLAKKLNIDYWSKQLLAYLATGNVFHLKMKWQGARSSNALIRTVFGHLGGVNSLAITVDGRTLISGGADGNIRVWNIITGEVKYIYRAHDSSITSVAIAADGQLAISGDSNGDIKTWYLSNGVLHKVFPGHVGAVHAIDVTSDGRIAVSGGFDGSIRVWDLVNGVEISILLGHIDAVNSIALTEDGLYLISGSDDGTVRLWNLVNYREVSVFHRYVHEGEQVVDTDDGYIVVSMNVAGLMSTDTVTIYDPYLNDSVYRRIAVTRHYASKGSCMEGHNLWYGNSNLYDIDNIGEIWDEEMFPRLHPVKSVAISPNGRCILAGGAGGSVTIWSMKTNEELYNLVSYTDFVHWIRESVTYINGLSMTVDGRFVVAGLDDGTVRVWAVNNNEKNERTLVGHNGSVRSVVVTPDLKHIISGSTDGMIKLWSMPNNDVEWNPNLHTSCIRSILISSDGKNVISGADDGSIKVWSLVNGEEIYMSAFYFYGVKKFIETIDGQYLVVGINESDVIALELSLISGSTRTLGECNTRIRSVTISSDGSRVYLGDYNGRVIILDINKMSEYADIDPVSPQTRYFSVENHNGNLGDYDGSLGILDEDELAEYSNTESKSTSVYESYRVLSLHYNEICEVIVTTDNTKLITASLDHTLRVYDLEKEHVLYTLSGHTDAVTSIAITQAEDVIISCSNDSTIRIWELKTGRQLHVLFGHTDVITSVALTHNDRYIISCSADKTLKVWDILSGKERTSLYLEEVPTSIATAPDGFTIVYGDAGGNIYCLELVESKTTKVTR